MKASFCVCVCVFPAYCGEYGKPSPLYFVKMAISIHKLMAIGESNELSNHIHQYIMLVHTKEHLVQEKKVL